MPYIGNPIYQSAFVTDQFSGTGSQTTYTMSVAPAGTTNVLVVVSGVVQDPSTYGVVGNTLTFSTAPPSGTGNISCRYLGVPVTGVATTAYRTKTEFTATAGQTTFTPPSYTVNYIDVYRNGVLLGAADYTASNGATVVLATGATAGDLITTISMQVSSVLNALPTSGGNITGPLNVSGALGVGTTSPTFTSGTGAQIKGAGDTQLRVTAASFTGFDHIQGADGTAYLWNRDNTGLLFGTNNTERMRLNNTGALVLAGGTTTASGIGITFPSAQIASSNANTLDDYEEGTWTITDTSGAGLTIANSITPNYIKIGRLVYVTFYITYPSTASSATAGINLPFSVAGGTYAWLMGRFQGSTSSNGFLMQCQENTVNTVFNTITNSGGPLANSALSGQYLLLNGCYIANA